MKTKAFFTMTIALVATFMACHSTKQAGTTKQPVATNAPLKETTTPVADALAKPPANPYGLVTQGECLPQDKPFLDSLKLGLYKFNQKGMEGEYQYIDSVPIILTKVFPNVIFFTWTSWLIKSKPILMAHFNKTDYNCPNSFNVLYRIVPRSKNDTTIKDKAASILYLILGFKNRIIIDSLYRYYYEINIPKITCNYLANVIYNGKTDSVLFYIKRKDIEAVFRKNSDQVTLIYAQ